MMTPSFDVEAEVAVQQAVQHGGAATALSDVGTFAHGSMQLSWRGDSAYLATASQATGECVPTVLLQHPINLTGCLPNTTCVYTCVFARTAACGARSRVNTHVVGTLTCRLTKGCSLLHACRPHATLRVWSKQGALLHCGDKHAEEARGLLPLVAWQPNGRNIYCCQRVQEELRVCIFERNGLGHGSFGVPGAEGLNAAALLWSADSSVLALQLEPLVRHRILDEQSHCLSGVRG